jgi:hypothetical protein
MMRITFVTLITLAAFDHFMANGKYTSAVMHAASSILLYLGVM